jgi:outer membrane autotransporter barrel domain
MCSNWIVTTKKIRWRKKLATAVTLGILCSIYQANVQAAEYKGKLTSNITSDNLVVDGKASLEGNTVKYNFTENTTITNSYSWQELAALGITTDNQGYVGTIQPGGPTGPTASSGEYHNMLFDLNGHDFTVNHIVDTGIGQINPANPSAGAYISSTPLYIAKPVSMTFDNIGKMTLNNQSTGYYLAGIYAGYYRGLNTEEQELAAGRPTIVINNASGWDNAVTVAAGGGQYSENITGIKIFNCGELIIKGYADFAKDTKDADGKVISTKYYGLDVNTMGNRVNSSAHFAVGGGRWGQIYGYGNSLLELNTKKDATGNVVATNNDVIMVGDIQTYGSYSADITTVNLGLTTADSYWLGATYSGNENQVENLFLRNGGCWINNVARGSNIVNLHGGSSKENAGVLRFSNTQAGASISNYDGTLVAIYEHEDATPATMLGGVITIKSAAENSSIILQTSSNGIDVANTVAVNGVLDSLANKLFYTGYTTGERNLSGKVKIVEGLTTSSAEKAVGDIWYDIATGKGNYLKNVLSDYNSVLTGTSYDQQYIEGGLYYADGDIRSKNAVNISVNDVSAINVAKNIDLVIDMLGNNWNINSTSTTKDIRAVSVDENGSLTINNMGNIVIGVDGTSSVGFYAGVNADEQATDKASITINKNKTNTLTFNGDGSKDYTVIKAGKQGNITISPLLKLSEDLQNSAKTTIFDADGGNITYAGTGGDILKTTGYLVKANNGAQVKLGKYDGVADNLQGDISVNKGTSSDTNSTYVYLSLNKNQVWTGSAGGDGDFALRMGISGSSSSSDAGGIWYNQWLNGSNIDTHVATLDVFASLPANIYQKNTGKLYLDAISNGGVNVYYEHDKKTPTLIEAGATVIGHGTTISDVMKTEVFLKTDNVGIDMTSKQQVDAVLKALANKLVYTGYTLGERDINGHVEIMEGLLTSSAKLAGGLVNFNETTGQAFYSPQKTNMFNTVLTGGEDTEYVNGGIKDGQSYLLKENTTIETSYDKKGAIYAAIDIGSGKNVDLKLAGNLLNVKSNAEIANADDSPVAGISIHSGNSLTFTNGDLNISTSGNCKQAYGIYAKGDADSSAQNMLTITQKDIGGIFDTTKVLRISGTTGNDIDFTAIKATDNANVNISSKVQIDAEKGVAILADNGSNVLMTMSGSVYNAASKNSYINAAEGKLIVAGKNSKVSLKNTSTGDSLTGDIITDINGEGGEVNLEINNNSQWTGSVSGKGIFNITLNASTGLWNNQWQQGSGDTQVEFLKGTSNNSSPFGVIYQKNAGKLNINSFTGIVGIHYDHDGDEGSTIIGGDTVIKSSVAGGGWNKQNIVYVRTDPNGIDLDNQQQVNKVLNALAKKIYYKDAIKGGSASGYSLKGSAAITESITGGSKLALGLKSGSISFNNKTGQGYYYYAAPEQIASEFGNMLTGHNMIIDKRSADYEYAQGGVIDSEGKYVFKTLGDTVANKIAVDDIDNITIGKGDSALIAVAGITAQDVSINLVAENTLDITAKATEDGKGAIGVYTNTGKTANLNADNLVINSSSEKGIAYGLYNYGDTNIMKNLSIKSTGIGILAESGSVMVAGHATIEAGGIGVQTGTNGQLQLASGEIRAGEGKAAINAVGGQITLNVDGNGLAIVSGNISASNSGIADVTFSGNEAYFAGNVVNDSSTIKMKLKNGAVWNNTDNESSVNGAYINTFIGGDSKADAGIIKQESNNAITFNNYSGNTKVIYNHKEEDPTTILGGGVVIGTATKDSSITLVTDYKGIGTGNDNVLNVFEALANKVTYEEAALKKAVRTSSESINLNGTLEIAEGLLTSSATMKTSDLSFDSNGQGHVAGTVLDIDPDTGNSTQHTSEITYGNKQTAMMRGAKSAMVSSALAWRAENNDVMKRLGDLRMDANAEKGIWARIGGGKTSYDDNDTNYKTTFKSYQLGYDKTVGNAGWILGAAFSYLDGDSSYEKGCGTNKAASLSLYGSWLGDKGHYADIILRGSNVKADYKVYNDYGYKLEGDYDTMGMAVSAEYGRRIRTGKKGFYYEPQVEFTYSRLGSDSYDAHSDYLDSTILSVKQDGFNSLIGRIGLGAGAQNEYYSAFVKASLLHEFMGGFDTTYSTVGEQTKRTSMNFGDTWVGIQIGGTAKISKNSFAYVNLEKTFGGDVKMDWRADLGFRFTF